MGRLSNKSILFTALTILILAISFVWLLGLAQKYASSVSLDEWRELQLENTEFQQGLFFGNSVEDNILLGDFITEHSKAALSAIIAIDLTSGEIQTIAELGPQYIGDGHALRLRSARLTDQHIIWIENRLSTDPDYNRPRLYNVDVIPELVTVHLW